MEMDGQEGISLDSQLIGHGPSAITVEKTYSPSWLTETCSLPKGFASVGGQCL